MSAPIPNLARAIRTVLTADADRAAARVGFVRRRRKISGAAFIQTLVFGWIEDPRAPVDALAARCPVPGVTPQAFHKRFTPAATEFVREVLLRAVGQLVAAQPIAVPLLQRFAGVYVEDSTVVALPDTLRDTFPGCGGNTPSAGLAAIKAHVRWELTTGRITGMAFQPGRQPDGRFNATDDPLPAGALRLADLGYFDFGVLTRLSAAGVFWISRLPPNAVAAVGDERPSEVWRLLRQWSGDLLDLRVTAGNETRIGCRLLAFRCPPGVAARRREQSAERQRKKGRVVSERLRVLCEWTVFATNLPADRFTPEQVWVLYRLRWQVELLLKLWRSHGGVGQSHGRLGHRGLCEVYAKLLAMVVRHWLLLTGGGPLARMNPVRAAREARRFALAVADALPCARRLRRVLRSLRDTLALLRPRHRRRKRPSALELLFEPQTPS
ncbi:transposase is4 family protein : Transposase IS4 family protein OS=Herpetosiphon aurantiacus (strain ATCC 23779 / DSM 785) GN=Haur_1324 PE=4 SV=1: DDE_Tnp_1 [Gemmata massiliana]|uniref:Transposase IS4-like domain-containing protein n=1 Tax=Gemmata massiliana TaxID=1210884 RepID=A0A6P2DET8_9BACT|nr:IS4 family transposase [Gemmata massiliana]VTR99234.1 transposase is4 family protein : Transposase IS4 family protein OS=Herpetosiphon aurantiacus (strain ATCC 23779 / DSM 785) GN=Haur_1324 PE=4 SV=1: DDE_Tnp_1 [Gemmata massiliana]